MIYSTKPTNIPNCLIWFDFSDLSTINAATFSPARLTSTTPTTTSGLSIEDGSFLWNCVDKATGFLLYGGSIGINTNDNSARTLNSNRPKIRYNRINNLPCLSFGENIITGTTSFQTEGISSLYAYKNAVYPDVAIAWTRFFPPFNDPRNISHYNVDCDYGDTERTVFFVYHTIENESYPLPDGEIQNFTISINASTQNDTIMNPPSQNNVPLGQYGSILHIYGASDRWYPGQSLNNINGPTGSGLDIYWGSSNPTNSASYSAWGFGQPFGNRVFMPTYFGPTAQTGLYVHSWIYLLKYSSQLYTYSSLVQATSSISTPINANAHWGVWATYTSTYTQSVGLGISPYNYGLTQLPVGSRASFSNPIYDYHGSNWTVFNYVNTLNMRTKWKLTNGLDRGPFQNISDQVWIWSDTDFISNQVGSLSQSMFWKLEDPTNKTNLFTFRCTDSDDGGESSNLSMIEAKNQYSFLPRNQIGWMSSRRDVGMSSSSGPFNIPRGATFNPLNRKVGLYLPMISIGGSTRYLFTNGYGFNKPLMGESTNQNFFGGNNQYPTVLNRVANGFRGYVGEFIYYNRRLNDEEMVIITSYLKKKWNIT